LEPVDRYHREHPGAGRDQKIAFSRSHFVAVKR
jgi:hypothetical protein